MFPQTPNSFVISDFDMFYNLYHFLFSEITQTQEVWMESTSVFMGQFVSATELVMEVVYQQNIFYRIKIWLSVAYDEGLVEVYLLRKKQIHKIWMQIPSALFFLPIKFGHLLSPSRDLGIGLVWDNQPTPPHPSPDRSFLVRLLNSSSNWTKLSMRSPQLFSGCYQMILDFQTRFRLGSD